MHGSSIAGSSSRESRKEGKEGKEGKGDSQTGKEGRGEAEEVGRGEAKEERAVHTCVHGGGLPTTVYHSLQYCRRLMERHPVLGLRFAPLLFPALSDVIRERAQVGARQQYPM